MIDQSATLWLSIQPYLYWIDSCVIHCRFNFHAVDKKVKLTCTLVQYVVPGPCSSSHTLTYGRHQLFLLFILKHQYRREFTYIHIHVLAWGVHEDHWWYSISIAARKLERGMYISISSSVHVWLRHICIPCIDSYGYKYTQISMFQTYTCIEKQEFNWTCITCRGLGKGSTYILHEIFWGKCKIVSNFFCIYSG